MKMIFEDPSSGDIQLLNRLGIRIQGGGFDHNAAPPIRGKLISPSQVEEKILRLQSVARDCRLCGHLCRSHNSTCKMMSPNDQGYQRKYIHLGEEPEAGNTLVFEASGCNLQCCFCHRGHQVFGPEQSNKPFAPTIWAEIEKIRQQKRIESLSFIGGNPDQSLFSILNLLIGFPGEPCGMLPIVWHSNLYSTPLFYEILAGIPSIWVLDFKYFHDGCGSRLSWVNNYRATAMHALESVIRSSPTETVIVRHLLIPGHEKCCTKPLVDWLQQYSERILFHPMNYFPAFKAFSEGGELMEFTSDVRMQSAVEMATRNGLKMTFGQLQGEKFK